MSIPSDSTPAASTSSAAEPPRLVGADGLTNKERRKAKQAEKRKRQEEGGGEEDASILAPAPPPAEAVSVVSPQAVVEGVGAETEDAEEEEEEEEVEALSHKEKRKRRKLEKQGLLPSADGTVAATGTDPSGSNSRASAAAAAAPLPDRSKFAIWVGNLSFNTSAERLQEWLEAKGTEGISRVNMPRGLRKFEYNKGFAYIDLPSAAAVEAAVALSEGHLDGRRLLIKSASDFSGRPALDPSVVALAQGPAAATSKPSEGPAQDTSVPVAIAGKTGLTKTAQKILRSQKNPPAPTLFVGNLSFNSTSEGLLDLFERSAKARSEWAAASKGDKERKNKKGKRTGKAKKMARGDRDQDESSESDSEASDAESDSDSSDDSETESGSDSAQDEEKAATPRGAGIRKVRMGTFEDTGKCKGFAFVDFHTPTYATSSLIDPRNYRLDGRELMLEYAGADAVRRGAPKGSGGAPAEGRNAGPRARKGAWPSSRDSLAHRPQRGAPNGRRPGRFDDRERTHGRFDAPAADEGGEVPLAAPSSTNPNHKENQAERRARRERERAAGGGRSTGPTRRAKPGAALANAQRGKMGIDLTGEAGKRTTFD